MKCDQRHFLLLPMYQRRWLERHARPFSNKTMNELIREGIDLKIIHEEGGPVTVQKGRFNNWVDYLRRGISLKRLKSMPCTR